MKLLPKIVASALTLLAAGLLGAADMKPVARVMAVQEIETDDAMAYADGVAKLNEAAKAKLNAENYYRVFQTLFDGTRTSSVRVIITGDSVSALMKSFEALENDPGIRSATDRLKGTRKLASRTLYQCLRFDGTHKGAHTYTTLATLSDEAAYLSALNQLRALFDQKGFQDAKINVYRAIAGRGTHTHRIAINLPSSERLAALLDFTATDPKAGEWIAAAGKFRTVVANSTSREITK